MARTNTNTPKSLLFSLIKLCRPWQWVKNLFVVAPLFFTPQLIGDVEALRLIGLGFLVFCLLSSSVYIVNDTADIEADRAHPTKRNRPLASGAVSKTQGFILMGGLLVVSISLLMASLPSMWWGFALAYFSMNIAYSFYLKHVAIVDVFIVAAGFVLRVLAGCALVALAPSQWILACTGFLALFVGLGKRRDDLLRLKPEDAKRKSLEGYNLAYTNTAMAMMATAAVLTYTLYTMDPNVQTRLGSADLIMTVPFVVFAVLRYLQLCFVNERGGHPTRAMLGDGWLLCAGLGWIGMMGYLIYA